MKIAFVVHDYHRAGGHSRYVAELASRFSKAHEVHVFANTFDAAGDSDITFHRIPAWRATALTTVLTFAVPAVIRVRKNFDVVHVQGFCGPSGNVITTHICNEAWYRGLTRQGHISWRDRIFHLFATALERRLYQGTHEFRVIAISQRAARDVRELYGCTAPMHVIQHGVDLTNFSPLGREDHRGVIRRQLRLSEHETVFLFVGNLRKGAAECIHALSRLGSGHLIIVSSSDSGHYRNMANRLGCAGRVTFVGHTGHIERFYSAADALLLPTPYDSFALVVTEAMACGLTVISSREAGAAELIRHKENGLLLDTFNSVEELTHHMRSIQENRSWGTELGVAARHTVEAMSWDAVARRTMEVYDEVKAAKHVKSVAEPVLS